MENPGLHFRNKQAYQIYQSLLEGAVYPYFRTFESGQDVEVDINGKRVLMFGSNSYLNLHNHPEVKRSAQAAIEKYGTSCSGSPLLNGTNTLHRNLETAVAGFLGKEAALVFSTGFQVSLGAIPALAGKNDFILLDENCHASIIEGSRLSYAQTFKFRHNDAEDLAKKLKRCEGGIKLIVVEGLYSMDGDIADLPAITAVAEQFDGLVMIDSAHDIGVLGKTGAGASEHYALMDKIQLVSGTFSKSLGSIGGFIAGDRDTIDYLRHSSRSLIFSASMSPASAASALTALDILQQEPERIPRLKYNASLVNALLRERNLNVGAEPGIPIIPVYIGNNWRTFTVAARLFEQGVFVNPVVAPAVKDDNALIRLSVTSAHREHHIRQAIDILEKVIHS